MDEYLGMHCSFNVHYNIQLKTSVSNDCNRWKGKQSYNPIHNLEHAEEIPWLYLTCDLPPPPLYPDELQENIIPQVPFASLLTKFNGVSEKEYKTHKDSQLKRFQITRLPNFLIIFIKVICSLVSFYHSC